MSAAPAADRRPDAAARGIIATNVIVWLVAVLSGEGLPLLMWSYWWQSVVIGFFAVRRIQKLERFATDGFKINDRAVDPTPATRRQVWTFFILHYGLFHAVYFAFLSSFVVFGDDPAAQLGGGNPWWLLANVLGFFVSHGMSHREHVEADLRGTPNIGQLMFVPYIRIVPMHLTIIFGAMLGGGIGLLLFVVLKTVADVAMHKVEHRMLQRGGTAVAGRA